MRKVVIIFMVCLILACMNSPNQTTQKVRKPFQITGTQKRLNTAECKDVDDWYLEGFRVGKSYRSYKQKMFNQRIAYCHSQGEVTHQFKKAWEEGYQTAYRRKK